MPRLKNPRLNQTAQNRLENVILEFLGKSHYDELYETRIQKLIFYSEVYCIVHYRRRLTEAEYKPYMFGAFSPDVRFALNHMENIQRKRMIRHGKRTEAYSTEESPDELERPIQDIIDQVHEHTKNKSTPDLAQFSKESYLFKETDYDTPMKFAEFANALDDHPNKQELLENQLPEKVNISGHEDVLIELESDT